MTTSNRTSRPGTRPGPARRLRPRCTRWGLAAALIAGSAATVHADLYVANSNSNNLSVSIGGTNCAFFSGTVPVGTRPVGVAASPDGTRVYVTNMGDGSLSVIDTTGPFVAATVQVGGSPFGPTDVAVHPSGSRIYVISNNRVAVVDAVSLAVLTNIFVVGGATDVAVHPDGSRVYVTTYGGFVEVISTATNTVTHHLTVGGTPLRLALDPTGARLYVTYTNAGGFLAVMDTATQTVTGAVPVEGFPEGIAVHPSGARVYVLNNMNAGGVAIPGKLSVIDAATLAVTLTQDVGANPSGVAVDRSNVYVTVADGGGSQNYIGHLWAFDAASTAFVSRSEVGGIPAGVATFINPLPPALPASVRVDAIEVTQGLQDLAQSLTLIAGRRTFVRVHAKATGANVPNVTATLFGLRILCLGSSCEGVPLGPLMPVNTSGTRLAIKANPKRSVLDDSFLFELPWAWTEVEPLQLFAVLHTDAGPPSPTCRPDAPFTSYAYDDPTTLDLQFVRLRYSLAGTPAETTLAEQNQSESWIRRTYPLSKLVSRPDLLVTDQALASRVDRSAQECQDMDPNDQSLCAMRYIVPKLAEQKVRTRMGLATDAHGAYALIPQHPAGMFTRGACCTDGVGAGPANDADYAAHEIGHLLGRDHPAPGSGVCGHDAADPAYPHPLALIHPIPYDANTGLAGLDGGDTALGVARAFLGLSTYDFMSYCSPLWISDYTHRWLYSALRGLEGARLSDSALIAGAPRARPSRSPAAAAEFVAGDWLTVFGSITPGLPTPAHIVTSRVSQVATVPPRPPGTHTIRLIGAGGAVLADYSFAPDVLTDAAPTGGGLQSLGFGHVVPFAAGTTEIRIVDVAGGGQVLGVRVVSANPPVVTNAALAAGPDPSTGAVTLGWAASDPDGDPLTFDILFTRDGGATHRPLMLSVSGASALVDTAGLGGGLAQLRVVASDGVQTAFADTAAFALPHKPPRVTILGPGSATAVHLGQLVNFEGQATDPQDGVIPEGGLAWTVPGRTLGTGGRISVTDLPAGLHMVTLTATNSLGVAGTASVLVLVRDTAGAPGPTLAVGPGRIGWHVAAGESQPQAAALDVSNSGSGSLDFTAQASAPWLSVAPSAGTAPLTLVVTADPSGMPGGSTEEGAVTVTASGPGGATFTVPVTLSVGNTFVVGNAPGQGADQCPDDPAKTEPGACGCGVPDSQAGQACATGSPGVCAAGITACGAGSASCVPIQSPSTEACDGLDNDCDGATDEGNPGGGASCSTGLLGVCAAGLQVCSGGGLVCQQTTLPSAEICGNGVDEDCDGSDLPCEPPVDACTTRPVLDHFNRANGRIGGNWDGSKAQPFYRIVGQRLDVQAGGRIYWNPSEFGTSQAAFVTFSTLAARSSSQGLLLKVQSGAAPHAGAIAVVYDAPAHAVRVSTVRLGEPGWVPYADTAVTFAGGDTLAACARADGQLRIYKNAALVGTVTLTGADQAFFNPKGGRIGLSSVLARQAVLDDFGGGTLP